MGVGGRGVARGGVGEVRTVVVAVGVAVGMEVVVVMGVAGVVVVVWVAAA